MYTPKPPGEPTDAAAVQSYLQRELEAIAEAFKRVQDGRFLQTLNVAPTKPREPTVAVADGTNWNPGSGAGLYVYYGGTWHFAG